MPPFLPPILTPATKRHNPGSQMAQIAQIKITSTLLFGLIVALHASQAGAQSGNPKKAV